VKTRIKTVIGIIAVLVVLAAISAACTYHGISTECANVGTDCHISGISGAFREVATVDVLVVHGMGSPPEGYSDTLMGSVARRIQLTKKGDTIRSVVPTPYGGKPGILRETTFGDAKRTLRVHEVTWAPVINDVKHSMLDYDKDIAAARKRSVINARLKMDLVNSRLADPVLYLGTEQNSIQFPVKFALCKLMNGSMRGAMCELKPLAAADAPLRLIIVTESLGSRITFDTLMRLRREVEESSRAETIDALAKRTTEIYMLANQLPLLELSNVNVPQGVAEEAGVPVSGLAGFLKARRSGEERGAPRLTIVALSDPNDLLSYEIPQYFIDKFPETRFVNVAIGVSGPGLFRIVANPLEAHIGHERDPRVIRLIADGGL
jgi:hypothetical protein